MATPNVWRPDIKLYSHLQADNDTGGVERLEIAAYTPEAQAVLAGLVHQIIHLINQSVPQHDC